MAIRVLRRAWPVLAMICLCHTYTASQWEWRNPLPQGNSIADVQAFSASVCYAAGGRGTYLTTTSGGVLWRLRSISNMPDFTYLQFVDMATGILLGNQDSVSQLMKTTDGGDHWVDLHPAPGAVTSAFFLNADTGWAATSGALMSSSDGGRNWVARKSPGDGVTRLFFLNALTGWTLCQDTIFRTADGGASWHGTSPESMQGWIRMLDKVVFVTPEIGWLTGTSRGPNHFSGHLFKSTDGGEQWTEQLTVGEDFIDYRSFSDIEMRSEELGWAVSGGRIYKTVDGGKNWNEIATVSYLEQVSSADDSHLWGSGLYGALYSSNDGGTTWTPEHRGIIASLNDLFWLDQKTGFAAGDTLLLKTRDEGMSWQALPIRAPYQDHINAHAVWFADSHRGWVGVERSGGWGSLLLTTDGGETWQIQLDSVNRIFCLFFSGESTGWASSGNKVYRTTDGGATWHGGGYATNPGEIESLFFTSRDSGWAGGYLGLAHTTDGGLSWTTVPSAGVVGLYVKGMHFVSPLVGWVVGYSGNDGYIFRTMDGGNSWQGQPHPTAPLYTWPLGVTFVDENRGWVVGQSYARGIAFRTTDGGAHWEEDAVPLGRSLLRVRSQGPDVWILGDQAAILHSSLHGTAVPEPTAPQESAFTYKLEQNYPNPFNPLAIIKYTVGRNRSVRRVHRRDETLVPPRAGRRGRGWGLVVCRWSYMTC